MDKLRGKATGPASAPVASGQEARAGIGLCFNYQRGLLYESEYLFDVGMKMILKTLRDLRVRATFHCPAKLCDVAPDNLSILRDEGHEIAVLGFEDEKPKELTDEAVRQLVFSCRAAFAKRGLHPIGFRSPHSDTDMRLCDALAGQNFRYNSEHDHAKHPYLLLNEPQPLFRIPVYTDDRHLRRSEDTRDATISKHLRVLRKALVNKHFVSVLFHPWILGEDMDRMEHWQSWVTAAVNDGAKVGALEEFLPDADAD